MSDELIVTLDVSEGKMPGKPVGFYGSGRKSSIVFLPNSAPIRTKVRVRLETVKDNQGNDKLDGGGKVRYQAKPAPDEVVEQWLEENGAIVKFEVTLDWQHPFDSSKTVDPSAAKATKVLEQRPVAERDGTRFSRLTHALAFGGDWATSTVMATSPTFTPIERETVSNGQRIWKNVGEKPGPIATAAHPIASHAVTGGTWHSQRLVPIYDPAWTITVRATYQPAGQSCSASHDQSTTWGALPGWLQQELTAQYSLCGCTRQRIDPAQAAGYTHCETCRTKAACDQCGKVTGKVTPVGTRTVCDGCQPYVAAEHLLPLHLTSAHRHHLAAYATALLAGDP
ncbi:MAG: hypothetical protein AAB075_09600, partial [Gemmatimonadota bacterium]